jgi:hypothetical protein
MRPRSIRLPAIGSLLTSVSLLTSLSFAGLAVAVWWNPLPAWGQSLILATLALSPAVPWLPTRRQLRDRSGEHGSRRNGATPDLPATGLVPHGASPLNLPAATALNARAQAGFSHSLPSSNRGEVIF